MLFYPLCSLCSTPPGLPAVLSPVEHTLHHHACICYPAAWNTLPLDIRKACSLTHSGLFPNVISSERPPLFTRPLHVSISITSLFNFNLEHLSHLTLSSLLIELLLLSLPLMSVLKGQGLCFVCHYNPSTQNYARHIVDKFVEYRENMYIFTHFQLTVVCNIFLKCHRE